MDTTAQLQNKSTLDSLSREEILNKYKGLLVIAKKAKQAKDDISHENHKLNDLLKEKEKEQEAEKEASIAMKEMLESYTEQKLQLTNQLMECQKQRKYDIEAIEKLSIENESVKRQMNRLTEDNDALLNDLQRLEQQLQQVDVLGKEQKGNLLLLEEEVSKLKIAEMKNERLQQENNETSKALNELREKYLFVKNINNQQRLKFKTLKIHFNDVSNKLKKLKECKKILLETQYDYAASISQWQTEIIKASKILCKEFSILKSENAQLSFKLMQNTSAKEFLDKLIHLWQLSQLANQEYQQLKVSHDDLINKTRNLENLSNIKTLQLRTDQLEEIWQLSIKVKEEQRALEETNKQLKESLNVFNTTNYNNFEMLTKISDIQNLAEQVKNEFYLKEKQTSNALKQPADPEDHQTHLNLEELNIQLLNSQQSLEEMQHLYKQKERENTELLDEMRELNEALKNRGDLISRQQEEHDKLNNELNISLQKQQQLHNSLALKTRQLEEKHLELESITKEIHSSEEKIGHLEHMLSLNEEKVCVLSTELEILRSQRLQIGHLDDNSSEAFSSSTISKTDDLQSLKDEEESYEEKYNKLKCLVIKLKKKLQEQVLHNQNIEDQLSEYRSRDLELGKQQLNEQEIKQIQIDKLTQQQLSELQTLKAENKKLRSANKQTNVLNLEIEAVERSLSEVSNKLSARTTELKELKELLQIRDATIQQLQKEMHLVEVAKESELKHSEELKEQIDHLQNTLKDVVHNKQEVYDKNKTLEEQLEKAKLNLERAQIEMAETVSQHENSQQLLRTDNKNLLEKLSKTEEIMSATEKRLQTAERSAEDLRLEYLDYKVKAQTVLRKSQMNDNSREKELEEELLAMRLTANQSKTHLEALQTNMTVLENQNEQLTENNSGLQKHVNELLQVIEELRKQNDKMIQEMQKQKIKQNEIIKDHKKQIDSIHNSHQDQIQALDLKYQKQLEELRQSHEIGAANETISAEKNPLNTTLSDLVKANSTLMQREDAEGSECSNVNLNNIRKISNISLCSQRSHHDFMPLEELLNTPMNALNSDTLITSLSGNNVNDNMLQVELNNTKDLLKKEESRVIHLTALLTENEQFLAKVTQMNDMLKEELRRYERSMERQHHIHNSEYLKNVIMKFLTLNTCDERLRLVPVLNTILKLTRNETEMLNCVAKGQKALSDGNNGRHSGWSTLLTGWVSSNNS